MRSNANVATNSPPLFVKSHKYQPSKAELQADVRIKTTPEKLAKALLRPVRVVEVEETK